MKPNELRIGNFIQFNDIQGEIKTIALSLVNQGVGLSMGGLSDSKDPNKIKVVKYEDCKPIPLDEDWLEKFGFELIDGEFILDYVTVIPLDSEDGYYAYGPNEAVIDLSFVHALQNYAYVINSRELMQLEI